MPQFHLRAFSVDGRSVGLRHLATGKQVDHAAIKAQCYQNRYYGTDDAERTLAEIEGGAAKLIRDVQTDGHRLTADERLRLLTFINIQRGRTVAAEKKLDEAGEAFVELAKSGGREGLPPEWEAAFFERNVELNMVNHMLGAPALYDLKCIVLKNVSAFPFITCDSPSFIWNPIWRAIGGRGGYGMASSGLIAGMPLSPEAFVLAYDRGAYTVPHYTGQVSIRAGRDVMLLNVLVAMSAREALYFRLGTSQALLDSVVERSANVRVQPKSRTVELFEVAPGQYGALKPGEPIPTEGSSVVVTSQLGLEEPLTLSFMRRRDRVKLNDDGSAAGPTRSPAWVDMVHEYSGLIQRGVNVGNFFDFAASHPRLREAGVWTHEIFAARQATTR